MKEGDIYGEDIFIVGVTHSGNIALLTKEQKDLYDKDKSSFNDWIAIHLTDEEGYKLAQWNAEQ